MVDSQEHRSGLGREIGLQEVFMARAQDQMPADLDKIREIEKQKQEQQRREEQRRREEQERQKPRKKA